MTLVYIVECQEPNSEGIGVDSEVTNIFSNEISAKNFVDAKNLKIAEDNKQVKIFEKLRQQWMDQHPTPNGAGKKEWFEFWSKTHKKLHIALKISKFLTYQSEETYIYYSMPVED